MADKLKGTERGFWFKVGDDFFGMYDSADGPKLFFNRDKYSLKDKCWDVELVIGRNNTLFIFYWQGEVKISFRFDKHHESIFELYRLLQERTARVG